MKQCFIYRCCVSPFLLSLCIFRMWNIWVLDVFYYICRSVFSITLGLHVCIYIFMSAAHCSLHLPLFQVPHVYMGAHVVAMPWIRFDLRILTLIQDPPCQHKHWFLFWPFLLWESLRCWHLSWLVCCTTWFGLCSKGMVFKLFLLMTHSSAGYLICHMW